MREQIQVDGLRYQCVGAGNQCLGGNDGRQGAERYRKGTHIDRQHLEKRIHALDRI